MYVCMSMRVCVCTKRTYGSNRDGGGRVRNDQATARRKCCLHASFSASLHPFRHHFGVLQHTGYTREMRAFMNAHSSHQSVSSQELMLVQRALVLYVWTHKQHKRIYMHTSYTHACMQERTLHSFVHITASR